MEDSNILVVLIPALLVSIPAIISAIYSGTSARKQIKLLERKAFAEKHEIEASAAEKVSKSYDTLVESLQAELERMRCTQREMKEEISILKVDAKERDIQIQLLLVKVTRGSEKIARLQRGIIKLISQIEELGIEPAYKVSIEDLEPEDIITE